MHESAQEFNDTVTDRNVSLESAVPVEELSQAQRKAFETAKEKEPLSYSGEKYFRPSVCKDTLLICDEYKEYPEPPDKGLIEDTDGDLYFVWVVSGQERYTNFHTVLEQLSKLLALGSFAIFLSYSSWRDTTPEPTSTALSYGLILMAFALAYPYLLMFLNVTLGWQLYLSVLVGLPVMTWIVILAEIWRSRGGNRVDA